MRLSLAVVAALFNLAHAGAAGACRCIPYDTVEDQYERAKLVFFGRVAIHHDADSHETQKRYWEFDVEGIWKGPIQKQIRIHAHPPQGGFSSCDLNLEVGQSYLVFARTDRGYPWRFWAGDCSGTVVGTYATEALGKIGEPAHRFQ